MQRVFILTNFKAYLFAFFLLIWFSGMFARAAIIPQTLIAIIAIACRKMPTSKYHIQTGNHGDKYATILRRK